MQIKHGFNGFSRITRIRSCKNPRSTPYPQNPRSTPIRKIHAPLPCRGRIYPSRGTHVRQFGDEQRTLTQS
ncbi:MAG: hypothetical protein FWG87_02435 [Defluviitaleaceae bacterium]|nr:hypothetical protein [Defluviitaleaceae bacterium]